MIRGASENSNEANQYLPARMLNEFSYCPRLFYLEHVEGLFAHNRYTREGAARHKQVDKKSDALPSADEAVEKEKSSMLAASRFTAITTALWRSLT